MTTRETIVINWPMIASKSVCDPHCLIAVLPDEPVESNSSEDYNDVIVVDDESIKNLPSIREEAQQTLSKF